MRNLFDKKRASSTLLGLPLEKVVARLDSLLFVLKNCKSETCTRPWKALHTSGSVETLRDALSPRFDAFYTERQTNIVFDRCETGFILDAEGPRFHGTEGEASTFDANWHQWE
jgi:hypothetical protein